MVWKSFGSENSEHEIFIARVQDTISRHSNLKGPAKLGNYSLSVEGTQSEKISPIQRMRDAIHRHNSRRQETNKFATVEGEGDCRPQIEDDTDSETEDDFVPKSLANFIKEIDQNLEASRRELGIDTVKVMDTTLKKEMIGRDMGARVSPCRTIPFWGTSDDSSSTSTLFMESLKSQPSTSSTEHSRTEPPCLANRPCIVSDFQESKIPQPKIYSRDILRNLANQNATKIHNFTDAENQSPAAKHLESPIIDLFLPSQFSNLPTPKAGTAPPCKEHFPRYFESSIRPCVCTKDKNEILNAPNFDENMSRKHSRLQYYLHRSKRTSSQAMVAPNLKKVRVTISQQSSSAKPFAKYGISNDQSFSFIANEFQKIDFEIARLRLMLRSTPDEGHKPQAPSDGIPGGALNSLLECLEIECDDEKSKGEGSHNATRGDVIEDESISDFFIGMKDMLDRGVNCMCKKQMQNYPNRCPLSPIYEKEKCYSSSVDIKYIINSLQRQQRKEKQEIATMTRFV